MTHASDVVSGNVLADLKAMRAARFEYGGRPYPLVLPEGIYTPDLWTGTLVNGLVRYLERRVARRTVVEIGVGSGAVPVALSHLEFARSLRYVGLDVNLTAGETARLNMQLNGSTMPFVSFVGGHLVDSLPQALLGDVDILAGNLPQVPDLELCATNVNDYYHPQRNSEGMLRNFEQCGMGLLLQVLTAGRAVLSPGGAVILAVAGRCGWAAIASLFEFFDMEFEILERVVVRQDPHTRITSFVEAERKLGHQFAFFSDQDGRREINAQAASYMLGMERPVYHDLFAVAATYR